MKNTFLIYVPLLLFLTTTAIFSYFVHFLICVFQANTWHVLALVCMIFVAMVQVIGAIRFSLDAYAGSRFSKLIMVNRDFSAKSEVFRYED